MKRGRNQRAPYSATNDSQYFNMATRVAASGPKFFESSFKLRVGQKPRASYQIQNAENSNSPVGKGVDEAKNEGSDEPGGSKSKSSLSTSIAVGDHKVDDGRKGAEETEGRVPDHP